MAMRLAALAPGTQPDVHMDSQGDLKIVLTPSDSRLWPLSSRANVRRDM